MWYNESLGIIKTPRNITVNGVRHPASIFRSWSKEELAAIGVYPARSESVDQRLYNAGASSGSMVYGEWVISYDQTPKDITVLKEEALSKVQATVLSLLSSSDWMVLRFVEDGTVIPQEWADYRQAVRLYGTQLESQINAIPDFAEFTNFSEGDWPVSPDAEQE